MGACVLCAAAARSPRCAPCAHAHTRLASRAPRGDETGPRAQRTRGGMSGRQRNPLSTRSAGARVPGGSLCVRGRARAPARVFLFWREISLARRALASGSCRLLRQRHCAAAEDSP